jgi:hypothetical protein
MGGACPLRRRPTGRLYIGGVKFESSVWFPFAKRGTRRFAKAPTDNSTEISHPHCRDAPWGVSEAGTTVRFYNGFPRRHFSDTL